MLCKLHTHLPHEDTVLSPAKTELAVTQILRQIWSGRRGSNPRLSPWQGDALPLSHSRITAKFDYATNAYRSGR